MFFRFRIHFVGLKISNFKLSTYSCKLEITVARSNLRPKAGCTRDKIERGIGIVRMTGVNLQVLSL